jgi:hypothetical protein
MDFIPQNELETVLVAAATDPTARPRFYELLSKSDLLVIDESPGPGPARGRQVLEAGRSLQLRSLDLGGVPHIPVFSSRDRISAVVKTEVRYLAMNAKALFEIVAGSHLILNPGAPYGKQLTPEEIAQVVDGSIFAPRSREVVAEARQVLMGQPASYPTHVTNALAAFFKTKKEVGAAYLAHVLDPKIGATPHTMIGVEVDAAADYDRLMGEAAIVLDGVAQKGELINFVRISEDGGVSDYMTKQTKPFYRRKWLGLF